MDQNVTDRTIEMCTAYPKEFDLLVSVFRLSAESRFVSGMWVSPCELHFFRVYFLKVRLLILLLFPGANE